MMQAMTVRQGGAEAVCAAIRDGMRAAGYARALDQTEARCEALAQENAALRRTAAKLKRELEAERKRARDARRHNRSIYRARIEEQAEARKNAPWRRWQKIALVLFGALALAVIMLIIFRPYI